jgi:hypothetical protein
MRSPGTASQSSSREKITLAVSSCSMDSPLGSSSKMTSHARPKQIAIGRATAINSSPASAASPRRPSFDRNELFSVQQSSVSGFVYLRVWSLALPWQPGKIAHFFVGDVDVGCRPRELG